MKDTHTLLRQEAEVLLEKTLDSIFITREAGTADQDLENMKRATASLADHYSVTKEELNYVFLTASIVTIEIGEGTSFPLDTFWNITSKLVTKAGGQV